MLSEDVFGHCMEVLLEVFRGDLSPKGVNAYFEALKGLSSQELEAATHHAIKECDRMPRPAALIGFVRGRKDELAERAWHQFYRVFKKHGASCSIACPDPVTAAAVRQMGGLSALARRNAEDFARFGKRDFVAAWKHCSEAIERGELEVRRDAQTLVGRMGARSQVVCLPDRIEPPALRMGRQSRSQPRRLGNWFES